MKTYIRFLVLHLCAAVVYVSSAFATTGDSRVMVEGKRTQLERAAVNYEWAARAQEKAAQKIIAEGETIRNAPYDTKTQYYKNIRRVGDLTSRAGDLEAAVGNSYDQAASIWLKISKRMGKKDGNSSDMPPEQMAQIARQSAIIAYQRSAELYELSAQAYYEANDPLRQASLCQKAARMREKIAQRL